MSSVETTERESAAVAVAPRVALADIEAAIAARFDSTAESMLARGSRGEYAGNIEVPAVLDQLKLLSICILVMRNGFIVVGKSAPASPENFNAELGRKFAYEDCIRQLWPLMGFALREKLASR